MVTFFGEKKAKKRGNKITYRKECERMIDAFFEVSRARRSGINGIEPLGDDQIMYWAALSGGFVTFDVVDGIKAIDRVYVNEIRLNQKNLEESE